MEIRDMPTGRPMPARDRRRRMSLLVWLETARIGETMPGGPRHRLLKRCLREARAERKRASRDGPGGPRMQGSSPPAPGKSAEIPKRSQIHS